MNNHYDDYRPHRAGADTEHRTFDEVVEQAQIRTEYETNSEMLARIIRETSLREWVISLAFGFGVVVMLFIMLA